VTVTGPRGSLTRSFNHVRCVIEPVGSRGVKLSMYSAGRRQLACLRSVATHVENLIIGVTKGFLYKLRMAYSHFPINVDIESGKDGAQRVEVRNFLGQKRVRIVDLIPGVTAIRTEDVKDQIEVTGNDIEDVSKCAARIHQSCLVRSKDIRKFLDGIYVSEKGAIGDLVTI
jgi:large subunit ribosomal protein L9e